MGFASFYHAKQVYTGVGFHSVDKVTEMADMNFVLKYSTVKK